jgi:hypothetical protein
MGGGHERGHLGQALSVARCGHRGLLNRERERSFVPPPPAKVPRALFAPEAHSRAGAVVVAEPAALLIGCGWLGPAPPMRRREPSCGRLKQGRDNPTAERVRAPRAIRHRVADDRAPRGDGGAGTGPRSDNLAGMDVNASAPWRAVERQGELEAALGEFDFSHAFVREASAVAPTILLVDNAVMSPESPGDARIVVVAQGARRDPAGGGDQSPAAVEFHLHMADSLRVPLMRDILITAEVRSTHVWFSLTPGVEWRMQGRALRWRFLTRSEAEAAAGRYGRAFPDDLQEDPRLWEPRVNWRAE